ncbi:MoxR family ATPase [Crocosphaera sp.]|uniref:AAA family ATPase n=1 Tax=Crocosphaera sp. TaxID=2729996 RepID=UPI00263A2F19|nr:MoxR family ATPase [Crocosphaera sp.]MDJ0580696.1 MoxR family ATPase [Crocosphaera sp.]
MTEDWHLFRGNGQQREKATEILKNLEPPPWRKFGQWSDLENSQEIRDRWPEIRQLAKKREREQLRGKNFRLYTEASENQELSSDIRDVINAVNAAIYLRRPLLVTGNPGSGKSTLAYAIAHELDLGTVLSWSITARTTIQEGLYRYDAIGRLQDAQQGEELHIGNYIKLGALGTAFLASDLPRVLLIDEIDKSDINLPNDLLNLLEEGQFPIDELVRRSPKNNSEKNEIEPFTINTQDEGIEAVIEDGWVRCQAFPIIVMTSNGERDFPPAFKRRCLRITMPDPKKEGLEAIVKAHFGDEKFNEYADIINSLISEFLDEGKANKIARNRATDQLLNTIYVLTCSLSPKAKDEESVKNLLLKRLSDND